MKNKILFLAFLLTVSGSAWGQSYNQVMQMIQQNNLSIAASQKYLEAETYNYKTGLAPEDPTVEYGYFPGNKSSIGIKQTLDVTMGFDFPTTYFNKKKISRSQAENISYLTQNKIQDILLIARDYYFEIVYLNKYHLVLTKRNEQAHALLEAYQEKFNKGGVNILDLNKAKMELAEAESRLRLNESMIAIYTEKLSMLNYSNKLVVFDTLYPVIQLQSFDTLYNELVAMHPLLKSSSMETELANQQVSLSRSEWLPDLEVGYSGEDIKGDIFQGIKVGISIPLWHDLNKVRYSKMHAEFARLNEKRIYNQTESWLRQKYTEVLALKKNYEEYEQVLTSSNSLAMLEKSLKLGQISLIEYLFEMTYYYRMYDQYLFYEKSYHLALSEMYRFNL
ncbi:MAG: TolC family protein [Bacteroidales bacterium]|nr:TolC family protein [Bacteroidota bacterium]MBL6949630.1 TolC family protein [Bacteroidales bacterium]